MKMKMRVSFGRSFVVRQIFIDGTPINIVQLTILNALPSSFPPENGEAVYQSLWMAAEPGEEVEGRDPRHVRAVWVWHA
jgi:hypothetical protein